MIFVTVGTTSHPFDRLLSEMDRIASRIDEEVVMQTGPSDGTYPHTRSQGFMSESEMRDNYDKASVIVCHGGVGTIMNGLERNIPLVVVPRKADLGEVDTDHQHMIAKRISSMGRGVVVDDITQLERSIECARQLTFPPYEHDTQLCDFVSDLLSDIESRLTK